MKKLLLTFFVFLALIIASFTFANYQSDFESYYGTDIAARIDERLESFSDEKLQDLQSKVDTLYTYYEGKKAGKNKILVSYLYFKIGDLMNDSNIKRMLIVLAAPSVNNDIYSEYFDEIVDFQVGYIESVSKAGNDEIRILVDEDTREIYEEKLDNKYIVPVEMYDIWMRDFATVNPENPVLFEYTDASMSKSESRATQDNFYDFAADYKLNIKETFYILDGGNLVDNYNGKVITTTRFLEDNKLTYEKGKEVLKEILGADQVAIIEPDDEVLAHSDGMVAWIDDNVLAVNDYRKLDPQLHKLVLDELEYSFPDTKIVTIPVKFDETGGVENEKGIGSACGININLVSTYSTLYVPVFGNNYEKEALDIIKANTNKKVVEINAQFICKYGGSARCTAWQLAGENMETFLKK